MIDVLSPYQLKKTLEYLYGGVDDTTKYLIQINAIFCKAETHNAMTAKHRCLLWLVKNKLSGRRLVEFFEGENGFLGGMNYILNNLENRRYHKKEIKISDFI